MVTAQQTDTYFMPPAWYEPSVAQYNWAQARYKYGHRWLCGGVGSGKSFGGGEESGEMSNTINPGKRGMIVVPNFDHFDDTLLPILKEIWPPNFEVIRRGNKPKIMVHCGDLGISEILLRSAMNKQTVERIDGP